MLSFEKKCAIFESFPELKRKKGTNGRINYDYKGSKVQGKNVAIQLTPTGSGFVVGKYLKGNIAKKYQLNDREDINITKFTDDRLRTVIQEAIDSMS